MSSAPSLPPRAAHPRAKWFLLALVLAALSVLWLIVPSIQHWRSDADPPQKTVITLTITPQTAADIKACPKLTPERLQRATTALAATMTSNFFGVATFTADHWFRGGPADVVEVRSSSPASLTRALRAAKIDTGRVLIASRSGEVLLCGETAPYTTELASDYVGTYGQGQGQSASPSK